MTTESISYGASATPIWLLIGMVVIALALGLGVEAHLPGAEAIGPAVPPLLHAPPPCVPGACALPPAPIQILPFLP